MQVIYGFVYYFCLLMASATVGLSIFAVRPLRKAVFNYLKKIKLMKNLPFQSTVYVSFFVIFSVMIASIWTYLELKNSLEASSSNLKEFNTDSFELPESNNRNEYLHLLKSYRQFYLSERNFMLTSSALFIAFVFHRLCATIAKLNDLENDIESGNNKPDQEQQKQKKEQNQTFKQGNKQKTL